MQISPITLVSDIGYKFSEKASPFGERINRLYRPNIQGSTGTVFIDSERNDRQSTRLEFEHGM